MGYGHESRFASAGVIGVRRERRTVMVFKHEHHRAGRRDRCVSPSSACIPRWRDGGREKLRGHQGIERGAMRWGCCDG